MNEKYITDQTLDEKVRVWLAEIQPYSRTYRRHSFKYKQNEAALLVIDMQRYFLDPVSRAYLPAGPAIIPRVQQLQNVFRQSNRPIFFTRYASTGVHDGMMGRWWKELLLENDALSDIIPSLRPQPSECCLFKNQYSAFVKTNLDARLQEKKITQLVVSGVMTHLCCESTVRDAFMRGFEVFLPIDATATRNEDLHIASLKMMADGFAVLKTTEELLHCLPM
jgi:isochorismate hydrolase